MIERLYVHNFRCLENFTLDLAGRPSTLLIGKNGAGKSTTLQCLKLFQSIGRGAGRVGSLVTASDFTQGRTEGPMRFEIDLKLSAKRYRYAISFEWPEQFREARILDESLSVDGQDIFTRHQAQVQLSAGGAFGLDWHVFALPVIKEKPGERAIQDVKGFAANTILTAPIPANMTGFSEEPSFELEYDASNVASCLRALIGQKPAAYTAFEAYVKSVIADFSSFEFVPRGERGEQLIVHFGDPEKQRGLKVEFKALSDGEKCFFLSGYILASNTVGSPVFCAWDEPDNHLSISEVGQFVTGLRRISNRGGQFIGTSHHPETVRNFTDDTTLVLTRASHLDPVVVRALDQLSYTGDLVDALARDEIIGTT